MGYFSRFSFLSALIIGSSFVFASPSLAWLIRYKVHLGQKGDYDKSGRPFDGEDGAWAIEDQIEGTDTHRVEEVHIILSPELPSTCKIKTRDHRRGDGWVPKSPDERDWGTGYREAIIGRHGDRRRLEAFHLKLVDCPGWSIEYGIKLNPQGRPYLQESDYRPTFGKDGSMVGTEGEYREINDLWIRMVPSI